MLVRILAIKLIKVRGATINSTETTLEDEGKYSTYLLQLTSCIIDRVLFGGGGDLPPPFPPRNLAPAERNNKLLCPLKNETQVSVLKYLRLGREKILKKVSLGIVLVTVRAWPCPFPETRSPVITVSNREIQTNCTLINM